jgi:hypothetical protein
MWWCVQFGHQYGPMSLDELKAKLRDVDTREVFVWRGGFKDWKRVEDVTELTPPRPLEPPPFRVEAQKRKPIPSNTPSVKIAARSAGAAAALASVVAMLGIAGLLDASAVLPRWSDRLVGNFILWFTIGLAFAAYHGGKQYMERKFSDTGENRLGPQPIYQPEEIPPRVGNRLSDHNQSTASLKSDTPTKTTGAFLPTPQPSALDLTGKHYYPSLPKIYEIIDHEVSQLEPQDSVAREDLYKQARRKLFHKLRPDGRWNIQWQWKAYALEKAIRWVEAEKVRADRQREVEARRKSKIS